MSGRDSPRVVVYGDEWAVTAAVCSLVSQRWPQAVVERASGLSALVQTLRRHGAAGVLLCLRPHEHIPVLDALTPVPSCGGDEGRRGGVTYGAEGEDSESVPASCAGGAGYGDGGGGGMPLYRGVLQRYPVTGPADLLCAGGGCQRQDEPVRNSIHRLTGDNRCQNPDGPLNKKSSTLPPSGVLPGNYGNRGGEHGYN
ncbi:TPA: hypothetical protein ACJGSF_005522 [Salmonella enterica subsp. enterica serovar Muenchen]|nr:hypothetical protein [Salmonella enterica]